MTHFKPLLIAVAIASMLSSGCAGLGSLWKSDPAYPLATKERPASQIIAMWHPARGTHEGRPARGFAGNIMFFTARDTMPALVNGTVRVYVFDNQGTLEEQGKPIRQYDFPAEVWNTYAELSKIGPAYNVFIPYPRPGNHEVDCTVSMRLIPEDGGPALFSENAYITLDGVRGPNKGIAGKSKKSDPQAAATDEPPLKQSYKIAHETVMPKRVVPVSAKSKNEGNKVQTALAEQVPDRRGGTVIERVNFESSAADDEPQNERAQFVRSRVAENRSRRGQAGDKSTQGSRTPHPLTRAINPVDERYENDDDSFDSDEDFADQEVEETDTFDAALKKQSPQKTRRHPLGNGSDVITVKLDGLHAEGDTHGRSAQQRRPSNRHQTQPHPLTELDDDFEPSDREDYAEFEDDDADDMFPLTQ